MLLQKLKAPLAPLALAGFLAVGWAVPRPSAAQEPRPDPKPPAKSDAKAGGRMAVWRQGKIVLLDPADPKSAKVLVEPGKGEEILHPSLCADGRRVAYLSMVTTPPGEAPKPQPIRVMIRDLDGRQAAKEATTSNAGAAWGADADELVVYEAKLTPDETAQTFHAKVLNLATGKATDLPVPAGHFPFDMTRDGKAFLTIKSGNKGWKPYSTVCRLSRDGKKVEDITDPAYLLFLGGLSPDGKTMAFTGLKVPDDPEKLGQPSRLYLQPVGGKVAELPGAPAGEHLAVCWSPDGKRIAYLWRQMHAEQLEEDKPDDRETETRLYVCDADGKNHRVLLSETGKGQRTNTLAGLDWR